MYELFHRITDEEWNLQSLAVTVDKSPSRKFALFVRLGGEGKAHTYAKRCYQQSSLTAV
jgi:hypothetical protein